MKYLLTKIPVQLKIFIVLFLILELGLRIAGNKPGTLDSSLYPVDTFIYHPRFKADPGGTGITIYDKDGGNLPDGFLINEQGFRSPFNFDSLTLDSLGRGQGKKVVLMVGDSYTEGCCAEPVSQSFPDLLLADDDFLLLNFGVGGMDLLQYKLVLDKYVREIQPDLVVVNFYLGNDIYLFERPVTPNIPLIYTIDNFSWLNSTGPSYFMGAYPKPYLESPQEAYDFYLNNFTLWGQHATTFEKIIRPTISLSRIYLGMRKKIGHIKERKNKSDAKPNITLTNTLLRAMKETTESNGAAFIVLGIPSPEDVIRQLDMEEAYGTHFAGTAYFFPDLAPFSRDDYDGVETRNHFTNSGHRKFYQFAKQVLRERLRD
ncbi:hypothetical protein [Lewinella sp. LCG006]|uniref:hypothetical protein n=1 Tax=Lewinella sp. LCG006 TaxID=3231911 RepID=UPI003460985F